MKYKVYTVYDAKALFYAPPFFQVTDGAAVRALAEVANDPQTSIGRHPRDYSLYCIGEYDDQLGCMLPCEPKVHICDAQALLQLQNVLPGMALDRPEQPANPQPGAVKANGLIIGKE